MEVNRQRMVIWAQGGIWHTQKTLTQENFKSDKSQICPDYFSWECILCPNSQKRVILHKQGHLIDKKTRLRWENYTSLRKSFKKLPLVKTFTLTFLKWTLSQFSGITGTRKRKETVKQGLPCSSNGKESTWNAGDLDLISGLGRSSGEGNGNPFQYSCLKNPMDRRAWWATVHRVTNKSDTTERLTLPLPGKEIYFLVDANSRVQ